MWRGLPASVMLHSAVVFGGAIAWPYLSPPPGEEAVIVPIELVDLAPVTNVAPSIRREVEPEPEEPEETPPPVEEFLEDVDALPDEEVVEEDTAPPPPPPPEEDEPEPEPEPVPDLDQEEEAEPEPEPEPEEEEPEPIRAEPEQDDPLDDILGEASNLFDRARTEQRRAPPPTERKIEPLKNETTERRRGVGDRSGMTARVEAILLSQLKTCWVDVQDLPNPERLIVTVKMQLNVDGTINGDARLVEPSRPPIGDNAMQQAITRALRAARKCSPYRLPEGADAYYEEWKDITLVVGPDGR